MAAIGEVKEVSKFFEWRIENFSLLPVDGTPSFSPLFSFDDESWYLAIHPNGDLEADSVGHIGLCLFRNESGPPTYMAFSLSLKTLDGKRDGEVQLTRKFEDIEGWGLCKYMERSTLLRRKAQLMPSDTLTIVCVMKYDSIPLESTTSSVGRDGNKALPFDSVENCTSGPVSIHSDIKVLHDFKELFLKKEDCDVIIEVQGIKFQAHRIILRARSPVLASTFRNNMKEQATGVIQIEDCDPSSFADFLCFLYCGEVKNLSLEKVFGLFYAADKYDVQDLKEKCLDFLKENLCVDTFCETISVALRHSETELLVLATDFFIKNAPNIILTAKWQSFLAENPTESNELFIKLLVPKSNTSNLS